jgi:hypothetical protein
MFCDLLPHGDGRVEGVVVVWSRNDGVMWRKRGSVSISHPKECDKYLTSQDVKNEFV